MYKNYNFYTEDSEEYFDDSGENMEILKNAGISPMDENNPLNSNNDFNMILPPENNSSGNMSFSNPSSLGGGMDPNMMGAMGGMGGFDMMGGMGELPKLSNSDLGKLVILKTIYTKLITAHDKIKNLSDYRFNEICDNIKEALEHFKIILDNYDIYKEGIDYILVVYKRFLLSVIEKIEQILEKDEEKMSFI